MYCLSSKKNFFVFYNIYKVQKIQENIFISILVNY